MDNSAESLYVVHSDELPQKIFTIPNILTVLRIALLPFLICALHRRSVIGNGWAISIGSLMIITDLLDGWIARTFKQYSRLGWVLDPVSDKIIIDVLAIYFAIMGNLPYWVAIVIVCRDLSIMSFGITIMKKEVLLKPNIWGKLSPFFWGISFILLTVNLYGYAWIAIIIALILSIFSAGIYYSEYKKTMEALD
ncbi:CDP-alcohol phosphatidyltransferase family protein [bacterium]|nr:CDP-alcohol phosphatidyltransferase family protein [bacterium]